MERLCSADKQQQLMVMVGASDETVISSNVTPCQEIFISEYLAEFDGRVKSSRAFFEEVDYLFDLIYHDDYIEVINGVQVSKEQLKNIHAKQFSLGYKASIVQCQNAMGSVMVNYRLSNDKNDMFIHSSVTIEGNRFKRARTLDDSFGKFLQISGQPFKIGKLRTIGTN